MAVLKIHKTGREQSKKIMITMNVPNMGPVYTSTWKHRHTRIHTSYLLCLIFAFYFVCFFNLWRHCLGPNCVLALNYSLCALSSPPCKALSITLNTEYTHVHTYMETRACVRTLTCVHTHTHTHTYTCKQEAGLSTEVLRKRMSGRVITERD